MKKVTMNKYAEEIRTVYYAVEVALNTYRNKIEDIDALMEEAKNSNKEAAKEMVKILEEIEERKVQVFEDFKAGKHQLNGGIDLSTHLKHEEALTALRLKEELERIDFQMVD